MGVGELRGSVLQRYALPQRRYIGPTSMDTELAFLMCNTAQVMDDCGMLGFGGFVGGADLIL